MAFLVLFLQVTVEVVLIEEALFAKLAPLVFWFLLSPRGLSSLSGLQVILEIVSGEEGLLDQKYLLVGQAQGTKGNTQQR